MYADIRKNIERLDIRATREQRLQFLRELFRGRDFDTHELAMLMRQTYVCQGVDKPFGGKQMGILICNYNPRELKLVATRPNTEDHHGGRHVNVYRFV